MDFTTIDTATRIFLFASIFATTAIASLWLVLSASKSSSTHQMAAIAGALATIPAALAAVSAPAPAFNVLALVAIGGLALTLTAVTLAALATDDDDIAAVVPQPMPAGQPVMAVALPAPLPPAELPPATRVATFESLTSAGSPMGKGEVAETMIHGASFRPVSRIAFVAHQTGDGTAYRLGDDTHIGRGAGSTIVLEDTEISREHARVKFENGRFVLYDLGGLNGTHLQRDGRKRKITTPTLLNDQDVIVAGRTRLAFFEVAEK